jgi:phospholipid/cholesterol/gamma-HCH transport system substrate-binding protein
MQQKKVDVWVGLFVLLGVAALVALVLRVGGKGGFSSGDTYKLHANITEIGNLKVRSPVKLAGVTVGRVEKITLNNIDNVYKAEVVLSISSAVSLPKDTSLAINTSGLIGEQYVHLTQGFEKDTLKAGDEVERTEQAMGLEDLVRTFISNKVDETAMSSDLPAEADKK